MDNLFNKLSPVQFVKIEKIIDEMNHFKCDGVGCEYCPFYLDNHDNDFACMAVMARFKLELLRKEATHDN